MNTGARKAAVAAYKERDVAAGIYAVRCAATGQRWVGRAPDLATIRTRLWFTLRQGISPHRSLQSAWSAHGEDAFSFEQVEALEEESSALLRDRLLKRRQAHWASELGAEAI